MRSHIDDRLTYPDFDTRQVRLGARSEGEVEMLTRQMKSMIGVMRVCACVDTGAS